MNIKSLIEKTTLGVVFPIGTEFYVDYQNDEYVYVKPLNEIYSSCRLFFYVNEFEIME